MTDDPGPATTDTAAKPPILPGTFFTRESLGTLSGAVGATYIISIGLAYAFGLSEPKIGFIIAQLLCILGVYLSRGGIEQYSIGLINGFLVFVTASGAANLVASQVPAPSQVPTITHVEQKAIAEVIRDPEWQAKNEIVVVAEKDPPKPDETVSVYWDRLRVNDELQLSEATTPVFSSASSDIRAVSFVTDVRQDVTLALSEATETRMVAIDPNDPPTEFPESTGTAHKLFRPWF